MIRLAVDSTGLARSRFAVSPLIEAAGTLMPWGVRGEPSADPWVYRARRLLRREDLPLLTALAVDRAGYLPDFLTPYPSVPSPDVADELEQVRTTPPERVVAEMEAVRVGRPANGLAGRELPDVVRETLDRGGRYLAERAADELGRYWESGFAAHWPQARAVLEAEVDQRALTLARYGAARLFDSLHPSIRWDGGTLRVDSRFDVALPVPMVLLVPSLVAYAIGVSIDPVRGVPLRPPALIYPARPPAADAAPPRADLARLLGPTRADLLASLDRPATTTALASTRFLSPATVSYHLGVLRRAGLVSSTRSGREVLYLRTPQGGRLLSSPPG